MHDPVDLQEYWHHPDSEGGQMAWTSVPGAQMPLTKHATTRTQQRNIPPWAVDYVLDHGTPMQRTGITFCVLRWCDIPRADRRIDRVARLEGTVLLLAREGAVITAYRAPKQSCFQEVRRKAKGRSRRPVTRSRGGGDVAHMPQAAVVPG